MLRPLFVLFIAFLYCIELSGKISENSVNVITGIYEESNTDIAIPGPLPFTLKREFTNDEDGYPLGEGWKWKIEAKTEISSSNTQRLHFVPQTSEDENLMRIQVKGAGSHQVLSWVRFNRRGQELEIHSHDGQLWKLEFDGSLLKKVTAPGNEFITYDYHGRQISRRCTSQGHLLENEFYCLGSNLVGSEVIDIKDPADPRIGRVKIQKSLISKDGDPIIIAQYFYRENETEVRDVRGARKIYRFSTGRVTEVDTFSEKGLLRRENFIWKDDRLISKTIYDGSLKPIKELSFEHDEKGRLVKETLSGNLTGAGYESYSRYKKYNDDGNLEREWEDNRKYVKYQYDPVSGLVKLAESGMGNDPAFRTEFHYDNLGILVSTSQYDMEKDRVKDVLVTPSDDPQSAGLPIMIEEIRWDEASDESVQKTILNSFTARGKICEQTIIDNDSQTRRVVRIEYDDFGREIYSSDSSGDEFLTVYHPEEGRVIRTNLSNGETTESHYNFQKRVTYRKAAKNDGTILEQKNRYDQKGNLISSCDVLGNETTYTYDSLGRLIKKKDPKVLNENEKEVQPIHRYEYDCENRLIAHTDPNGHVTRFDFTARGKPFRIQYPDGTTDEFAYNPDGTLKSHKARDGLELTYERDSTGRVIDTHINGKPKSQKKGPQSSPTLPTPQESRMEVKEHLEYSHINERGQRALQKIIVQEDGKTIISTFDALGRIEKMEMLSPMGTLISKKVCRYDGVGQLTLQRDFVIKNGSIQGEIETRWKYHAGGQVAEKTEFANTPTPRTTLYSYNAERRLQSVRKPDGVELHYHYTPNGDLNRLTSSDSTIDLEYLHDEGGRPVQVIDHATSQNVFRDYDEEGRLISESLGSGLKLTSSYDQKGRRISLSLPDGSGALYEYDNDQLKAAIRTDSQGQIQYVHSYTHYNQGFLSSAEMIGSLGSLKIMRNPHNHITSISTPYWSQKNTYAQDQLSGMTIRDILGTEKKETSFNDRGQLTREGKNTYEYDSIDNVLSSNEKQYTINELNQVVRCGDIDYTYDPNGNLISKNTSGNLTVFKYDALDRLVSVATENHTIRYTYDAFHRRTSKQVDNEEPVYYLLDGNNEIGTVDPSGNIKEFRLLGLGHGAEIGAAVSLEIDGRIYAPIHDHRGSVAAIVDMETQTAVETYRYNAYGTEEIFDEEGNPQENPLNPWRFSSKRVEPETGLVHFGKREYCPELCRWTSQDPLGCFDSVNRFAFAQSNPLQNIDLYGLFSISVLWESIHSAAQYINKRVCDQWSHCADTYKIVDNAYQFADHLKHNFILLDYLYVYGFHDSESHTGVYGNGFEPHEKYRITFVNGILTTEEGLRDNLQLISESHGGCNVHYCYVGTRGWTNDLIRSLFSKIGVTSIETKEIAGIWKNLIRDMGGVDSGGIIFHYAHSLGGTETLLAKHLMTPEELKMIRVITMGSPTLIPDDGFHSVVNIISCRDIISIFDPIRFFHALLYETNSFFVGSPPWDGMPGLEHMFDSYWNYLRNHFWDEIEEVYESI